MVLVLKVVLAGPPSVGKSHLFCRWCTPDISLKNLAPTRTPECDGVLVNHHVVLEVWDLPGVRQNTKLFGATRRGDRKRMAALESAHLCVLVCDAKGASQGGGVLRQLVTLRREIWARTGGGDGITFLVLVNKMSEFDHVVPSVMDKWCKDNRMAGWLEVNARMCTTSALKEVVKSVASVSIQTHEARNGLAEGATSALIVQTARRRRRIRERLRKNGKRSVTLPPAHSPASSRPGTSVSVASTKSLPFTLSPIAHLPQVTGNDKKSEGKKKSSSKKRAAVGVKSSLRVQTLLKQCLPPSTLSSPAAPSARSSASEDTSSSLPQSRTTTPSRFTFRPVADNDSPPATAPATPTSIGTMGSNGLPPRPPSVDTESRDGRTGPAALVIDTMEGERNSQTEPEEGMSAVRRVQSVPNLPLSQPNTTTRKASRGKSPLSKVGSGGKTRPKKVAGQATRRDSKESSKGKLKTTPRKRGSSMPVRVKTPKTRSGSSTPIRAGTPTSVRGRNTKGAKSNNAKRLSGVKDSTSKSGTSKDAAKSGKPKDKIKRKKIEKQKKHIKADKKDGGSELKRMVAELDTFVAAQWQATVGEKMHDDQILYADFTQFKTMIAQYENDSWFGVCERLFRACQDNEDDHLGDRGVTFEGYSSAVRTLAFGSKAERASILFEIFDQKGRGKFNVGEARGAYETFFVSSEPVQRLLGLGEDPGVVKQRLKPHIDAALARMFTQLDPLNNGDIDRQNFVEGFQKGKVLPIFCGEI